MAFLDDLQSHCGGLVRLPTPLFWYGGRGWDDTPGRLCLLLDADAPTRHALRQIAAIAADPKAPDVAVATTAGVAAATTAGVAAAAAAGVAAAALLLIDGQPGWIWVTEGDVEFL